MAYDRDGEAYQRMPNKSMKAHVDPSVTDECPKARNRRQRKHRLNRTEFEFRAPKRWRATRWQWVKTFVHWQILSVRDFWMVGRACDTYNCIRRGSVSGSEGEFVASNQFDATISCALSGFRIVVSAKLLTIDNGIWSPLFPARVSVCVCVCICICLSPRMCATLITSASEPDSFAKGRHKVKRTKKGNAIASSFHFGATLCSALCTSCFYCPFLVSHFPSMDSFRFYCLAFQFASMLFTDSPSSWLHFQCECRVLRLFSIMHFSSAERANCSVCRVYYSSIATYCCTCTLRRASLQIFRFTSLRVKHFASFTPIHRSLLAYDLADAVIIPDEYILACIDKCVKEIRKVSTMAVEYR